MKEDDVYIRKDAILHDSPPGNFCRHCCQDGTAQPDETVVVGLMKNKFDN